LQRPAESIAFLEYYRKHLQKVKEGSDRLRRASVIAAFLGLAALSYAIYSYMTEPIVVSSHSKRLQASQADFLNSNGSIDTSSALNGMSVFVWGLVLAKANQGLSAASSKDSSVVGGTMKKAFTLIFMIVLGSVLKLGADM